MKCCTVGCSAAVQLQAVTDTAEEVGGLAVVAGVGRQLEGVEPVGNLNGKILGQAGFDAVEPAADFRCRKLAARCRKLAARIIGALITVSAVEQRGRRGETAAVFRTVGKAAQRPVAADTVTARISGKGPEAVRKRTLQPCRQGVMVVEDILVRNIVRFLPGLAIDALQGQVEAAGQPGIDRSQILPDRTGPVDSINRRPGAQQQGPVAQQIPGRKKYRSGVLNDCRF